MNFPELLICAKAGDNDAAERILTMYQPLLVKESVLEGALDEDLYQEQGASLRHPSFAELIGKTRCRIWDRTREGNRKSSCKFHNYEIY